MSESLPRSTLSRIPMDESEADDIYNDIIERVEEVESTRLVEQLVLGVKQYKALCVISEADYGHLEPEQYFDEFEVIVVPGSTIQPVKPNNVMLTEYLR